jgi:hypothetical protein
MLGLALGAFTALHVVISLVGLVAGAIALVEMLREKFPRPVTVVFLSATALTSGTGFLFHSKAIGPPHVVGVISLVVLAVALFAFYKRKLVGRWRAAYIATALLALYLNFFVGIVQAFGKIGFLSKLAPTQTEPPFLVAQIFTLVLFVGLGAIAVRRNPAPSAAVA